MNLTLTSLHISPEQWAQMKADVETKAPEEACGIIAGEDNHAQIIIPITNILHSPFRFRMDPQEELLAFYLAEEKSLDILAVYHSHPQGLNKPSHTDFVELTFPGIIYLIWYEHNGEWNCRGYKMNSQSDASEISLIVEQA